MLEEVLSLTIDVLFAAVGIGVVAVQLARQRGVPAARYGPSVTWTELVFTAVALTVVAIGPNVLVFGLSRRWWNDSERLPLTT